MKIEIEVPDDWSDLEAIYQKQLDAKLAKPERFLKHEETWAVYDAYHQITRQNDFLNMLLYTRDLFEREFIKGKRCSVCGMTPEQAEAVNYDCAREC